MFPIPPVLFLLSQVKVFAVQNKGISYLMTLTSFHHVKWMVSKIMTQFEFKPAITVFFVQYLLLFELCFHRQISGPLAAQCSTM